MATKVIFDGVATLFNPKDPNYPTMYPLDEADFNYNDALNIYEMVVTMDGTSIILPLVDQDPVSKDIMWRNAEQNIEVGYFSSRVTDKGSYSERLAILLNARAVLPDTITITIEAHILENVITYSAVQNGGSIYDNLKELYSSVTGEDAKGHNPSEVIDELKGKLGGGDIFELSIIPSQTGITSDRTPAEVFAAYNARKRFIVTIVDASFEASVIPPFTNADQSITLFTMSGVNIYNSQPNIQAIIITGVPNSDGSAYAEWNAVPITWNINTGN